MNKQTLIKKLLLQIQILKIQIQILLLRKKLTIPNLPGPEFLMVHYEGANNGLYGVNNWHKQRWGWKSSLGWYVGYAYFLSKNGVITQTRRDNEEQAHCVEPGKPHYWNTKALSICLEGDGTNFTSAQYQSLKEWLDGKREEYGIPYYKILGHRDVVSTVCPSDALYKWLKEYKNA